MYHPVCDIDEDVSENRGGRGSYVSGDFAGLGWLGSLPTTCRNMLFFNFDDAYSIVL